MVAPPLGSSCRGWGAGGATWCGLARSRGSWSVHGKRCRRRRGGGDTLALFAASRQTPRCSPLSLRDSSLAFPIARSVTSNPAMVFLFAFLVLWISSVVLLLFEGVEWWCWRKINSGRMWDSPDDCAPLSEVVGTAWFRPPLACRRQYNTTQLSRSMIRSFVNPFWSVNSSWRGVGYSQITNKQKRVCGGTSVSTVCVWCGGLMLLVRGGWINGLGTYVAGWSLDGDGCRGEVRGWTPWEGRGLRLSWWCVWDLPFLGR